MITAALALNIVPGIQSQLLSEAAVTLPRQTETIEYDNLDAIRNIPNYRALREHTAIPPLSDLRSALDKLGIEEEDVREIIIASDSRDSFGLFRGVFAQSVKQNLGLVSRSGAIREPKTFCPGARMCLMFLRADLVAFGSDLSLKRMLEKRQNDSSNANGDPFILIKDTNPKALIRGVVTGNRVTSSISELLGEPTYQTLWLSSLIPRLDGLTYSVHDGPESRISTKLYCKSRQAALLVANLLTAVSSLEQYPITFRDGLVQVRSPQIVSIGKVVGFEAESSLALSH